MAASDWIKVRTILPTDGRLRIASRKCHVLPVTAFGALVTLWCLADSHADESGELIGYTSEDVDTYVGVPGFCAAMPEDWIDTSGEFVKLPEYQEHNGTTAKTRAQDNKRQKRHRQSPEVSRSERDKNRTRGEESREEKKEQKKGATAPDPFFPEIDPQVVADFRKVRERKKAPLTATAVAGIRREAAKAGLTLESVLAMCCERGWSGFKAEWVTGNAREPASLPRLES